MTCIHPKIFEKQIKFLVAKGYRFSTISKLPDNPAVQRTIAISFDDGYKDISAYALPLLAKLGIPATVFIITDFIGLDNRWDVNLGGIHYPHLSVNDIRDLHQSGWEIGSHSLSHRSLRGLMQNELIRQIGDSKNRLEELIAEPVRCFAPPFGNVSPRIIDAALHCGYQKICGFYPLKYYDSAVSEYLVLRLAVYRSDSRRAILAKLSANRHLYYEVFKQNIINFCSNATVIVNSLR